MIDEEKFPQEYVLLPVDERDLEDTTYPCGHTARQVTHLGLGCTPEGECRPHDAQLSEQYWAEKGVTVYLKERHMKEQGAEQLRPA